MHINKSLSLWDSAFLSKNNFFNLPISIINRGLNRVFFSTSLFTRQTTKLVCMTLYMSIRARENVYFLLFIFNNCFVSTTTNLYLHVYVKTVQCNMVICTVDVITHTIYFCLKPVFFYKIVMFTNEYYSIKIHVVRFM